MAMFFYIYKAKCILEATDLGFIFWGRGRLSTLSMPLRFSRMKVSLQSKKTGTENVIKKKSFTNTASSSSRCTSPCYSSVEVIALPARQASAVHCVCTRTVSVCETNYTHEWKY